MGGLLADLVRWVFDVVHAFGYVGVFVLILAGSLFLPVPTELTLPLVGFLIGNGRLSLVPVLLTATAARVCAALVMYAVGFRLREARLRRVIKHFERSKLMFVSEFERASAVFERHGGKAILVGHLIPGAGGRRTGRWSACDPLASRCARLNVHACSQVYRRRFFAPSPQA